MTHVLLAYVWCCDLYLFVCVCVCVCMRARARVRVCANFTLFLSVSPIMSMCTFSARGLHTQFSQKAIADHDLAFDTACPEAGGD